MSILSTARAINKIEFENLQGFLSVDFSVYAHHIYTSLSASNPTLKSSDLVVDSISYSILNYLVESGVFTPNYAAKIAEIHNEACASLLGEHVFSAYCYAYICGDFNILFPIDNSKPAKVKASYSLSDSREVTYSSETFRQPVDLKKKVLDLQQRYYGDKLSNKQVEDKIAQEIHSIQINTSSPIALTFLSDLHIGDASCDYKSLFSLLDTIHETPSHYIYLGGDGINNFIVDKLFHAGDTDFLSVQEQWELYFDIIYKYNSSILAIGDGNHEAFTKKKSFCDLKLLKDIHPLYVGGEGAYINLYIGDTLYKLAIAHKLGGGNNNVNRHNAHKTKFNRCGIEGLDIIVQEHYHCGDIESWWAQGKKRFAVNTGSFKVLDSYAKTLGFDHSSKDAPTAVLFPNKRKIVMFENYTDAIVYMRGLEK